MREAHSRRIVMMDAMQWRQSPSRARAAAVLGGAIIAFEVRARSAARSCIWWAPERSVALARSHRPMRAHSAAEARAARPKSSGRSARNRAGRARGFASMAARPSAANARLRMHRAAAMRASASLLSRPSRMASNASGSFRRADCTHNGWEAGGRRVGGGREAGGRRACENRMGSGRARRLATGGDEAERG